MYEISKEFSFSAAHFLKGLPSDHPCGNGLGREHGHGHNYTVKITLSAPTLDSVGFVLDYRKLDTFKLWLDTYIDHRHLNYVIDGINPTAENLAKFFYDIVLRILGEQIPPAAELKVSVSETDKTWASYTR